MQLVCEKINVTIWKYWIISTNYLWWENFLEILPKFIDWILEYLKYRACRISVMSTKSSGAICSVFNEQTSIALKDADRYAGDKLISCLEDSNRRVFRFWEVENTNFSAVISRIFRGKNWRRGNCRLLRWILSRLE